MKHLTTRLVQTAGPGKHYDGDGSGLFLLVKASGRRSFVQRLAINGKVCDIGIGSVRWTTLAEARKLAYENQRTARRGGDPRTSRAGRVVPTFEAALEKVLDIQRPTWRNGKSEAQWRSSLRDYAGDLMGKPVDAIGPGDVLAVLTPIWSAKRETAKRVRQRIGAVLKWAIAEGHRTDNPVDAIGSSLPKNGIKRGHFTAVPFDRVSDALARVRASRAWWATKAAFEFLVLTAARSGEIRGMVWSEVDLDAAVWAVPASRMKTGRDHRVPLSDHAIGVLREAREYGDVDLVFPAQRGGMMSDMTISKLVKELGIEGTPHGMRSAFRDYAAEQTNIPREVCEEALAHVNPNRVESAYRRSDLFDKRRDLMRDWAEYLAD